MEKRPILRGFTLIEVMIFIAIIAIIFAGTFQSLIAYRWIAKENMHSEALRQMLTWKKLAADLPMESLSPCIVTISADGKAKLPQKNIVENSITLYDPASGAVLADSSSVRVDSGSGEIKVTNGKLSGKKAVAKFSFLLPTTGETAVLPASEPCRMSLINAPASKIEKVELVEGSKFEEIPPYKYKAEPDGRTIGFDKSLAGKTVRVIYYGGLVKTVCTGDFLDSDLNITGKPTGKKIVRIMESYNTGNDMETGLMRVK
ncbi:MAG: prepilin-type N-terminal cleavage/methylation domain-containing protein [Firmicutes bacterium]|nr:prepilin-type N-terminal cleavage/methylation domain-containing protein [Bacillota bacterium]